MGPLLVWSIDHGRRLSIGDLAMRGSVVLNLASPNRMQVLRELSENASEYSDLPDPDQVLNAVARRERELGSSALGAGVAIPHCRLKGLRNPVLLFGRLPQGIDWNAPDGELVKLVFLLCWPQEEHDMPLRFYRELVRRVRDDAIRQRLFDAETPKQVVEALSAEPTR